MMLYYVLQNDFVAGVDNSLTGTHPKIFMECLLFTRPFASC